MPNPRDVERMLVALRPRILRGVNGVVSTAPAAPVVHNATLQRDALDSHPGTAVTNTPGGLIASTNAQAAINELDDEKLARSGVQPMLGALDMADFDILNPRDITALRDITDMRDIIDVRFIQSIAALEFELSPTHTFTEGSARWDNTTGVKRLIIEAADSQKLYFGGVYSRVKNTSGSTLPAMRAVNSTGVSAGLQEVGFASSDFGILNENILGITMHDIPNGAEGWVCEYGQMDGPDLSGFGDGSFLWLGNATLLDTEPNPSTCSIRCSVGTVLVAANPGRFFVSIKRYQNLVEANDVVYPTTPGCGEVLTFQPVIFGECSGEGQWQNQCPQFLHTFLFA